MGYPVMCQAMFPEDMGPKMVLRVMRYHCLGKVRFRERSQSRQET